MDKIHEEMVKEFQCPGCTRGMFEDGCYKPDEETFACAVHSAGTILAGAGNINLGLPKGFNRLGPIDTKLFPNNIRLFTNLPDYDKFNVAVWAMEQNGYLLVRCYCPRINLTYVDVIKNGKLSQLPDSVFDVGKFIAEID